MIASCGQTIGARSRSGSRSLNVDRTSAAEVDLLRIGTGVERPRGMALGGLVRRESPVRAGHDRDDLPALQPVPVDLVEEAREATGCAEHIHPRVHRKVLLRVDIRRGAVFDEQSKASELLCFMLGNLGLALKGEAGDSLGLQPCLLGLPLPLSLLGEALQFSFFGPFSPCSTLLLPHRHDSRPERNGVRRPDPNSPPNRRPRRGRRDPR